MVAHIMQRVLGVLSRASFVVLVCATSSFAQPLPVEVVPRVNVTLAWDHSFTTNVTYRLYSGDKPNTYTNNVAVGTTNYYTISVPLGVTNYFVVTAVQDTNESLPSNEANYAYVFKPRTNYITVYFPYERSVSPVGPWIRSNFSITITNPTTPMYYRGRPLVISNFTK